MASPLPPEAHKFDFRGRAGEWFGIWIVNLLLSIVTIGIYSAWAKVRTKKYFYNATYIHDRNFDYHATGGQILIGRLIIVGVFAVFQIVSIAFPIGSLILLVAFLAALPWLMVRSIAFNARMSSFSNVRFGFDGGVGKAALLFLLYPFLVALTAYTTFPILDRAIRRYTVDNHRLGRAKFSVDVGLWPFYQAFLIAAAWVVIVGLIGAVVTGFSFFAFGEAMADPTRAPEEAFAAIGLIYILFFAAFLPAAFLYQALTRNAIYNGAALEGGHRFASNVRAHELLWIAVSNMVVVVCTLFLMLPWAQIRMARYLADHTGFIAGGRLDDFVDGQLGPGNAVGDAYTDLEGIDIGLPI